MSRDGEILNTDLLQAAADYLKIGGVKRYPKNISIDVVQWVYDLSNRIPVDPVFSQNVNHTGNFPANTLSVGVNLIGTASVDTLVVANANGVILPNNSSEHRILSVSAGVGYVAAGAITDVGIKLEILITLKAPAGIALTFPVDSDFAVVDLVSPYAYHFNFPGGDFMQGQNATVRDQRRSGSQQWDGFVPPGWSCYMSLFRQLGVGFFPALTSLDTYFAIASRAKSGDWKA